MKEGRGVTIVAIVILAAVALILVIFALRVPRVPDSGAIPTAPASDTGQSESPTDAGVTATPLAPTANPDPQLLEIREDGVGVRSTRGECGTTRPVVETTKDGGLTWQQVTLGDIDLEEVLAVSVDDADGIGLAARVTPLCAGTGIFSFTEGEFWQAYPERLGEFVYIDPAQSSMVHSPTMTLTSPCPEPRAVSALNASVLAVCDSGVVEFRGDDWTPIAAPGALDAAWLNSLGQVVVLSGPSDQCGPQGSTVSLAGVDAETPIACLQGVGAQPTISAAGDHVWLWSGAGMWQSTDAGITWSPIS